MDTETKLCSICGEPYTGFGHNAQPVNDERCCEGCNWEIVIPERIVRMQDEREDCYWREREANESKDDD